MVTMELYFDDYILYHNNGIRSMRLITYFHKGYPK